MSDLAHKLAEKTRLRGPLQKTTPVRITITIFSLGVCLFLTFLWVRSYTWRDSMWLRPFDARTIRVFSTHGTLQFESYTYKDVNEPPYFIRSLSHADMSDAWRRFTNAPEPHDRRKWRWETTRPGFFVNVPRRFYVYVPHWFPIVLAGALAAAPWINWRFSLRTLLIAITLIALLVGLIVILI